MNDNAKVDIKALMDEIKKDAMIAILSAFSESDRDIKTIETWFSVLCRNGVPVEKAFTSVKGAIFMPKIQTEKENKR